jgi:cytochrome oxidase Cu insertion factor (SCO1/SenC/PrrC family)
MNERLKKKLFILIIVLVFICTTTTQAELEPGLPLPLFKLTSLDGQEVKLQDYLGKVVIIHLWKCQ